MKKATFYHAGCPVCISAEQEILQLLDPQKVHLDIVHLGEETEKVTTAENLGVKSVPALVVDNQAVLHINYGASLEDLKT